MIIYQIYKKLLTMKLIIIFLLFNVLFSFYDVGDTISTDDQQIQANICSGSHPLVPELNTFSLSDINGNLNGGYYGVTMLSIQASW